MTKLSIPVGLFATLVLACLTSVPVAETAELPSYELTGFRYATVSTSDRRLDAPPETNSGAGGDKSNRKR
jgi:hypothetical protein